MASSDRQALIDALGSSDAGRQAVALVAVEAGEHEIDEELVDLLLPLLGAANKQISRRAAGLLSRAVADERVRARVQDALDAVSSLQRWGAAFALAAADMLDASVGEAALDALALDDGDIRWAAAGIVRAVAQRDLAFFARLEEVAATSSGDQRKMSLYCLRDLGHRDPDVYVGALDAVDTGTRHAALSGLQACGKATELTLAALVGRLSDEPDAGVRRSLAIVLGRIMGSHEGAASALRRAAAATDDVDFKRAVDLVFREG